MASKQNFRPNSHSVNFRERQGTFRTAQNIQYEYNNRSSRLVARRIPSFFSLCKTLIFNFCFCSSATMSSLLSSMTTATLLQKNLLHRPALMASRTTLQHHHQRCFLSSNEEPQSSQSSQHSDVFPVYTHHVSKIVLQHLQDARAGWLVEQGLASGLQIKANGTFLLHFPSRSDGGDGGKIWYVYSFILEFMNCGGLAGCGCLLSLEGMQYFLGLKVWNMT